MSSSILKVLIAGGGTGGHLFPAIAIGDELKKDNIQVKYIGSKYGIESSYKFIDKKDLSLLDLRGIQRSIGIKSILRNLVLPIKIIKSFYQVNSIIKTFKPDMIIGTGGYSCAIPLYIGIKNKILTAIQEQNVIPGMVTKKFHSKVNFIFISFKETKEYLNHKNLLFTGNPIRSMIKKIRMEDAKEYLGLSSKKFTILIMGGSQGASSINQHVINNYQKYIENKLGFDHAKELWKLGIEAVDEVKKLISEYNIKCNLQNGVISAGFFKTDKQDFLFDIEHMQKHYNFEGYKLFDQNEISEEILDLVKENE